MLQLEVPWVDSHDIEIDYILWGQIIDDFSCCIILFCQHKDGCNAWLPIRQTEEASDSLCSPMPASKSGTMYVSIIMNNCRFLHRILQFWGSSTELVGCGHTTFIQSFDSFNRAATATPSSFSASLDMLTWSIWRFFNSGKNRKTYPAGSIIKQPAYCSWNE